MALKKGVIISESRMRQKRVRVSGKYNPVLQKLSKNKSFSAAVDKPAEWRKIHQLIKEKAKGGLRTSEMRELADGLVHGKIANEFSHSEGSKIAKAFQEEFYPGLGKYKKADSKSNSSQKLPRSTTFQKETTRSSSVNTGKTNITPQNINIVKKSDPASSVIAPKASAPKISPVESIKMKRGEVEKFSPMTPERLSPLGKKIIESASTSQTPKKSANTPLFNRKITVNANQFHEAKAASMIEASGRLSPQAEAIIREKRRKMLAGESNDESGKGNFFGALAATKKNKRN